MSRYGDGDHKADSFRLTRLNRISNLRVACAFLRRWIARDAASFEFGWSVKDPAHHRLGIILAVCELQAAGISTRRHVIAGIRAMQRNQYSAISALLS
ncbi:hypothetical protein [uncultured Mycobacterium sp.]|uniref:hypothetical protein n=1 Tax=uncultured Mycobacterium sp. TaxID=171292 RepID=UPI0035CAF803